MMKTVLCRNSILLIIVAAIALGAGCDFRNPIKVGFSGQLTGVHANMGVSGRDGISLALDEINASGGIAGRKVELLIRDDKGTPEGARAADQELINAGVVAIIGHMTSSQSMAAMQVVEKAGMVLLSPTTSTPELTGRDDHFFRVISDSASEARSLARHIVHGLGINRIAAIYDRDNVAFTGGYLNAFSDELQKAGGQMVTKVEFSSSKKPVFGPIVAKLRRTDPEGLLIIASAYDGAIIAQQPQRLGWQTRLFGSGWSKSARLIENGGRSVEGMEFVHYHDPNSQAPAYRKFLHDYHERFQQTATFMASNAYEAMHVLAAALNKTRGQADGLSQALQGIRIRGLWDTVSIDQHGDGVRVRYRIVVQNGRFVTKERVK